MADLNTISTALAAQLASSTGLRAYSTAPGQIVPPVVVVIPGRPAIQYGVTMDGETTLNLSAVVLLSAANDNAGQVALNGYISSSGPQSIAAAVQDDPTLGGACEFALVTQVATYGLVEYAGQQYIGATFTVQCGANL